MHEAQEVRVQRIGHVDPQRREGAAAVREEHRPGRQEDALRGSLLHQGQLVDPGMTVASLSVPLVAPNTEFGDRINQLDFNITKTIRIGRISVQPKFDLFNALNVSPVYAVRSLNFGTTSYMQPSSILVGRVFQLGAIVKF